MNRARDRAPCRCRSPLRSRIVLFIGATSSSVENTARIGALQPTMLSKRKRCCSCARSSRVLLAQPLLLDRAAQRPESCETWNGLIRKSTAPRLIALTASFTPPKPVMTIARSVGNRVSASSRTSMPAGVGQPQIHDERIVRERVETSARRLHRPPGRQRTHRPRARR